MCSINCSRKPSVALASRFLQALAAMTKRPGVQASGRKARAKVPCCLGSLQKEAQILRNQIEVATKELKRQSNEIDGFEHRMNILQGNHNSLKDAMQRAFEAADLKFGKAKQAFKFMYGSIWRLQDIMCPAWFIPNELHMKTVTSTPFCGPSCAVTFKEGVFKEAVA